MSPEEYAVAENARANKLAEKRQEIQDVWSKAVEDATSSRDKALAELDTADAEESLINSKKFEESRLVELEKLVETSNAAAAAAAAPTDEPVVPLKKSRKIAV